MLKRVQETLESTYSNDLLARSKQQLEEAKKNFLRDLNKRDPLWRDKLKSRKVEEIKRMEIQKEKLQRELLER